jgi:nucleoside-diphosphate-sugar epimerase
MKIFVAGATGAVGKRLVPMLVENGHEVTGMTRSRPEVVEELGGTAVVADGLDRAAVAKAIADAKPDVVVHELTAIPATPEMRHVDRVFAQTNRLRTEGTDNLLVGALAAGARRFVAQSFAGWPYARQGGPIKSEDDPLDSDPPKPTRQTLAAVKHLERVVTTAEGIEGIVLRYAGFYGPGTSLTPGAGHYELIRKRRFPIVGDGGGMWSMVHIDDVAGATLAAIERGRPGIYNIADDSPEPIHEWLPAVAAAIGAKPPFRVPRWLGRIAAGEVPTIMMTEMRGVSNAKAKRELGWSPRYPSWREGFAALT